MSPLLSHCGQFGIVSDRTVLWTDGFAVVALNAAECSVGQLAVSVELAKGAKITAQVEIKTFT